MKSEEFNKKKIYSESSGVMTAVDSNLGIRMNKYGLYEEFLIDERKDISELALKVSPIFNSFDNESSLSNNLYSGLDGINFDKRIGYYQALYAGHVLEDDYRENSSSGGIGSWIFKELLENNLIDYVVHVKESDDPKIMFKYGISSTIEEIKKGAKTKYYPVELSEVLKIIMNNEGRYAVIGIPSFIYSIRLLMKYNEIANKRIKYTVGLICGHQKSSRFTDAMAWQVGIKPGNLRKIDYRYKLSNSPSNKYAVKMEGLIEDEKVTVIKPTSELFGQNWGWGLFKPEASNFTDDVFNETADIVIGDAWLPEYINDSEGNNIVIVRNTEINNLLAKAINKKKIKMNKVAAQTIFESQSSHYRHTHDELAYRLFKKDEEKIWRPQKRVPSNIVGISSQRRKIQDLRMELSKKSHQAFLDAVINNDFEIFPKQLSNLIKEYKKIYRKSEKQNILKVIKELGVMGILDRLIKK